MEWNNCVINYSVYYRFKILNVEKFESEQKKSYFTSNFKFCNFENENLNKFDRYRSSKWNKLIVGNYSSKTMLQVRYQMVTYYIITM